MDDYEKRINREMVYSHIKDNKKRATRIHEANKNREQRWTIIRNYVIAACRELKIKLPEDDFKMVEFELSDI